MVTDPPYVIGAVAPKMEGKSGGWGDMMNSARWFRDWYVMCRRLLKQDGALWTFCNWRSPPVVMRAAVARLADDSVLVRNNAGSARAGTGLRPADERSPAGHARLRHPRACYRMCKQGRPGERPPKARRAGGAAHPRQREARRWAVLDPFAGSGTTLRAAVNLGYRAVGVESEERWCDWWCADWGSRCSRCSRISLRANNGT